MVDWDFGVFVDENFFLVEIYFVFNYVELVVNVVWKCNLFMILIGGGVEILVF